MIRILLLAVLLAVAGPGDGKKKGREGNKNFEENKFQEAATAYQAGLQAMNNEAGQVTSGLYNNLGSAHFRMQQYDKAGEAYNRAMATAGDMADFSRAAYNAGNTSVSQKQLQAGLDYYRNALIADPNNENARYNYEFVKRQMQKNQNQQQNQDQNQDQQQQNQDQQQDQQDQNQNQDQNDQQDEQEQQQEEQQQEQQDQQNKMNREQVEQILRAMQNDEKQLLQQVRKKPQRRVPIEKDW